MKSKKIREFLWQHLKTHASNVHEEFDGDISLYTMTREIEEVPEHIIGSVIWFLDEGEQIMVETLYSNTMSTLCEEHSENHLKLMRLFNIINSTVWFNTLYTPRICMAEDNFYQICLVTRIPYRFFETAPFESADYITDFCPSLLEVLSSYISGVLTGRLSVEDCIEYLEELFSFADKGLTRFTL